VTVPQKGQTRESKPRQRSRWFAQSVWAGVWLCLAPVCTLWSAEIEGVSFAGHYRAGETTLVLNNVGLLRYRIFIKAYVAALYLGEGVRPEEVLADVPKRLEIHYFWSIAGPDFGKAAEKVLADNFPDSVIASLRSRLDRLHSLYENVKPGDRYALTYVPGVGMELALNGTPKGLIEGADFAAAYFAIWLGAQPLDASLKTQLLAANTAAHANCPPSVRTAHVTRVAILSAPGQSEQHSAERFSSVSPLPRSQIYWTRAALR